jgi:hypothetical protein
LNPLLAKDILSNVNWTYEKKISLKDFQDKLKIIHIEKSHSTFSFITFIGFAAIILILIKIGMFFGYLYCSKKLCFTVSTYGVSNKLLDNQANIELKNTATETTA